MGLIMGEVNVGLNLTPFGKSSEGPITKLYILELYDHKTHQMGDMFQ